MYIPSSKKGTHVAGVRVQANVSEKGGVNTHAAAAVVSVAYSHVVRHTTNL